MDSSLTWINPEDFMLSQIKARHSKTHTEWFHLHEVLRVVQLTETERMVDARGSESEWQVIV